MVKFAVIVQIVKNLYRVGNYSDMDPNTLIQDLNGFKVTYPKKF